MTPPQPPEPLTQERIKELIELAVRARLSLPFTVAVDTDVDGHETGYARVFDAIDEINQPIGVTGRRWYGCLAEYWTREECEYIAALLNEAPALLDALSALLSSGPATAPTGEQ